MAVVLGILVALVVALGVLLLVGASAGDERPSNPWRSLRAGLAGRRHPTPEQQAAQAAADVEPVDVSLEDLLRATAEDGDPYLRPDELSVPLHRVARRTGRGRMSEPRS